MLAHLSATPDAPAGAVPPPWDPPTPRRPGGAPSWLALVLVALLVAAGMTAWQQGRQARYAPGSDVCRTVDIGPVAAGLGVVGRPAEVMTGLREAGDSRRACRFRLLLATGQPAANGGVLLSYDDNAALAWLKFRIEVGQADRTADAGGDVRTIDDVGRRGFAFVERRADGRCAIDVYVLDSNLTMNVSLRHVATGGTDPCSGSDALVAAMTATVRSSLPRLA